MMLWDRMKPERAVKNDGREKNRGRRAKGVT